MAKIICIRTRRLIADLPAIDYRSMDRLGLVTEFAKYPELHQVPYELACALFIVAKTEEERQLCIRRMEIA